MRSDKMFHTRENCTLLTTLVIAGICVLPHTMIAAPITSGAPMVGPVVGMDDNNYTKLVPYNAANALKPTFISYCSWINAAMTAYCNDPKNKGYTFSWAGAANTITAADFNVTNYTAWAGTSNDITAGDGSTYNRNQVNQDAGGASLAFTYTPNVANGDPTNVRFIQAYNESFTGSAYQIHLDHRRASPFYDDGYAGGTKANGKQLANKSSWFLDSAYDTEDSLLKTAGRTEANEIDTSSDVQFQVAAVVDNGPAKINGVNYTHNLTLYAGLWWGYNYWNNDDVARQAPDPDVDPVNQDNEDYAVYDNIDPNYEGSIPEPASVTSVLLMLIPLASRRRRKD